MENETRNIHLELSVVMPCLNEADTLAICIQKAQRAMNDNHIIGEIVIADNGSTDNSVAIAKQLGVRVVHIKEKGYGSALMGGIDAADGQYIIMGDADDSYDFLEIPKFVEKLREGYDLVQGCRLPQGGGIVKPDAMPWSHRWIGNPIFTKMVQNWFHAPIHDVYCGLRGFSKELYIQLQLRCNGMEFATEMIIRSSLMEVRIAEVPITLHQDGRKAHAPHLKTVRDGWRTLRYFLMCCPRFLFLYPGILLCFAGLLGFIMALSGTQIGQVHFDAHTLLYSSVFILCGYQAILFSIFTKTFAVNEKMMPETDAYNIFFKIATLERGLLIGITACLLGSGMLMGVLMQWSSLNYGDLDYSTTMRWAVPGATLIALGFQTIFSGFFVSILGMSRKG